MSSLKQRINEDVKSAMRKQDKQALITLRMITAAIKQKEVDGRIELDDDQVVAIIDKLARRHKESIEQYESAGRTDLVDKEKTELEIVQTYLPQQLTDDEVRKLVKAAIKTAAAETMKDMSKVMGILKPELQGRTDMTGVSNIVKSLLS
jgi:uncharacterized protein